MINRKICIPALLLLAFLIYANSLNNGFVSDDIQAIVENPNISRWQNSVLDLHVLSNSVIYNISGNNPFLYHLVSVLVHCINTVLVFYFLNLFFSDRASFLGACLFAVHPIHTEAVAWISGRGYMFLAFFSLVTFFLYYRGTNSVKKEKSFSLLWYSLSVLVFSFYVIGTGMYQFYLFLFFIIAYDISHGRWIKNLKLWIPFLVIIIFRLSMARHAISDRFTYVEDEIARITVSNPVVHFIYSISTHFALLVWPARLTLYHDPVVFPAILRTSWLFLLIAIIFLLFFIYRNSKEMFFGVSIFIIFLAPTFSPIKIANTICERYVYFPSVALCMLAAFLYDNLTKKMGRIKVYLDVLFILIITAYGVRTFYRNMDWKNSEVFWQKTAEASPDSSYVHNNYGGICWSKGLIDKAMEECEIAVKLDPKNQEAYNNLGIIYERLNEKQKAIEMYNKAIGIYPKYLDAYNNLGVAYKNAGKYKKAMFCFKKAVSLNRYYARAYNNLGILYLQMGKKEKAISLYKKAIELNPRQFEVYSNLANIYKDLGDIDNAITLFKKAVEVNPNSALVYCNFGNVYLGTGNFNEAIVLYKKALESSPSNSALYDIYNNLISACYSSKQYDLAVRYCYEALSRGCDVNQTLLDLLKPYRK